jgi:hypothetical protein
MKRSIVAVLAFATIGSVGAVAQYGDQHDHDQQAQSHRVRNTNVSGYVRKDGENYVLENDKDKQRYRIQNSEAVREHEGHHVKVKARLHEDDRSLEVNRVNRLRDDEHRDHQ